MKSVAKTPIENKVAWEIHGENKEGKWLGVAEWVMVNFFFFRNLAKIFHQRFTMRYRRDFAIKNLTGRSFDAEIPLYITHAD